MSGLLSGIGSLLGHVNDAVDNVAETVSPGSTGGYTTTGNLISGDGATGDLSDGLAHGDAAGAVANVYADVVGPGGVIANLADGHGLGVEGLVGNVLGTADGLLGGDGGLLSGVADGALGGDLLDGLTDGGLLGGITDGLLGDATGGLLGTDGGLLGHDGGLLGGLLG